MLCLCLRTKTYLRHPPMYPVTTTSCVYRPLYAPIKKRFLFNFSKFDRQLKATFCNEPAEKWHSKWENVVKCINGALNVRIPF